MSDIVEVNPVWALLAPIVLGLLALAGAALNGILVSRAEGRSFRSGAATPVLEIARLMRQRRRTTVAADVLLWRIGCAGLVVIAVLKTAVIPVGPWVLADIPVGVVWFNAMDVLVWALVWLIGWGANSAHALVGGSGLEGHHVFSVHRHLRMDQVQALGRMGGQHDLARAIGGHALATVTR